MTDESNVPDDQTPADEEAPEAPPAASGRRTFGPIVLLGLASSGFGAVAASKAWVSGTSGQFDSSAVAESGQGFTQAVDFETVAQAPAASALALVCLAVWGVLLVTRGTVRRVIAWGGLLASVAFFVVTVLAPRDLRTALAEALEKASGADTSEVALTGWFVIAALCAAVSVIAAALGARHVAAWPEMGARYDAPADAHAPAEPESNMDLWKAIDEGRDPTA